MDTLLVSPGWKWRATDWAAGAAAGFAAGALLMVLDLLWSGMFNAHGPWRTSHMIAPIFVGTDILRSSGYAFSAEVVAIALAVHYAMGTLFGLLTGALLAQLELDAKPLRAGLAGAVLGIGLYVFNFDLVLVRFFPWLHELEGVATVAAHAVFGTACALLYWRLKRTGSGE